MIEVQRTQTTRILKQRDVQAGVPIQSAIAPVDTALAPVDAALARAISAQSPAKRCVTKEARLVPGADGTQAVEVRCSCGEWTRVELQVEQKAEGAS